MPLAPENEWRLVVGESADEVVFVGGVVVGCLLTDPGAPPPVRGELPQVPGA